jgi:hypothetical protein
MSVFKALIFSLLLSIPFVNIHAQYVDSPFPEFEESKRHRIIVGGDFGLGFGTITNIEVLPVIGWRLTKKLSVMTGPMYTYYRDGRFRPAYQTSFYGGRVLGRMMVYDRFFIQGEYNMLSFESFNNARVTKDFVLAGPGMSSGPFAFSILFFLYQPGNSPFVSPFLMRGGLYFTLK